MDILQWDVEKLPLPANSIDMIFTDPPYIGSQLITYKWLAEEAIRVLKPGKFVAAMCGGMALNKIMRWFDDAGLTFYWLYQLGMVSSGTGIVWINGNGNGNVPISTRTKHVLVYSKGQALSRTATTGLYYAGGVDKRFHHWGQDIDSHRYYIDCFSAKGDLVLDPLGGGGTTKAACAILERRCIIGDIDPEAIKGMKGRFGHKDVNYSPLPLFRNWDNVSK